MSRKKTDVDLTIKESELNQLLEQERKKYYKYGYREGLFKGETKGIKSMGKYMIKEDNKRWKKIVKECSK